MLKLTKLRTFLICPVVPDQLLREGGLAGAEQVC